MLELCMAALLVNLLPAGGFKQLDDFVAGHDLSIRTDTHKTAAAVFALTHETQWP